MKYWLLLLAALVAPGAFAQDKDFFFKKGDRVLFLGDSITEQYQYSSYIEMYLTTRYPTWGLTYLNAGIGGDTANGGAGRFQTHVLDEKPTAITINFGMNDAGYGKFDANRNKQYVEKTAAMLEMAKKNNVRVALVSPNAVDKRKNPNFKLYVETQKEFYAPLKGLAEKYGAAFADQYAITRTAVEKMEADKADKVVPYYDGFHTSTPGGLLMAHAILTELEAEAIVSDVEISYADKAAGKSTKAKVENVKVADGTLSFDRTDDCIPFPVLPEWQSLLPYVNNLKDLNYYGLTVKGLPEGMYTVSVDGKEVTQASAADLGKGVNLGNASKGPIFDQGNAALAKINAKNGIIHGRFRGVVMFNAAPDWLQDVVKERKPIELKKRLDQALELQKQIDEMVKPKTRKFEVKKAS